MSEAREPRDRFSDEEWSFLRYARFGELPHRVPPDRLVEPVDAEPLRDLPDPAEGAVDLT